MTNYELKKGFSLVELLVVITIIAVLSASSFAGFGYLGDILKVNEVSNVLKDSIKYEGLKILRGDFVRSDINFLSDFLVINQHPKETDLTLSFKRYEKCEGKYQILFTLSDDVQAASLIKKNKNGKVLNIKSVRNGGSECISFKNSKDTIWDYQLISSKKSSNIIRFTHFNIQRSNLNDLMSIAEGNGSRVEIRAPYSKKYFYDSDGNLRSDPNNPIKLKIKNQNSDNTFILQ